jgi:DNA mismatch endonuclease, patch repair protein
MTANREPRQWAAQTPTDESWKPPAGRSIAAARAEQDLAAGGRENRLVRVAGGHAHASVELKRLQRRVYAYLRYAEGGRTVNQYLGEAPGRNRHERLCVAWRLARTRNRASTSGR